MHQQPASTGLLSHFTVSQKLKLLQNRLNLLSVPTETSKRKDILLYEQSSRMSRKISCFPAFNEDGDLSSPSPPADDQDVLRKIMENLNMSTKVNK